MIDISVISAVLNIIWYFFTMLFFLYKFTSFFSYILNFGRFCWKLLTSVRYISNFLIYRQNYTPIETEYENAYISENPSYFSKFKNNIKKIYHKAYYKIFKKHHPNSIHHNLFSTPLQTYETSDSSIYHTQNSQESLENKLFHQHLDHLNNSEQIDQSVTDLQNFRTPSIITRHTYSSPYSNNINRSYMQNSHTNHLAQLNHSYVNHSLHFSPYSGNTNNGNTKTKTYNVEDSNVLFQSQFIQNKFNNPENSSTVINMNLEPSLNKISEQISEQLSNTLPFALTNNSTQDNNSDSIYNDPLNNYENEDENNPLLTIKDYI